MSGETLYPVFFVRVVRQGSQTSLRVVDDASAPAEGEEVIRAKVLKLVYEDKDEGADVLKLTVNAFDLDYYDNPWIKGGDLIKAKWGYPGRMSGQVEAVVTKIKGGKVLTIEANGKEYLLNRVVRPRVWDNITRSGVVRKIAAEYGYTTNAEIVDTELVFSRIVQAKLTDHELIAELAKREGFVFYIDVGGLYFGPRKLAQAPLRTITYYVDAQGNAAGDMMDFPTIESDLFARPGAVTAKGRDPDKKKDFSATADNDTTKGRPVVAKTVEVIDPKAGKSSFQTTVPTAVTVATTAKTAADAKRQVGAIYKNAQLGAVKLGVPVKGDPNLRAKSIVELSGIGAILVGKYYLTQVTHTVGETSYSCAIKGRREGMNSAGSATKAATKGAPNTKPAPTAQNGGATGDKLVPNEVVDTKSGTTHVEYR